MKWFGAPCTTQAFRRPDDIVCQIYLIPVTNLFAEDSTDRKINRNVSQESATELPMGEGIKNVTANPLKRFTKYRTYF